MNGQKADMVFTDPPYGVSYTGGVIHGNKINKNHKREMLKNDEVDIYSKFIKLIPLIIDPFLGSGSTLIACEKTNRVCYGMELDTKYCDVIIERWEQFTGQKANKITE